MPWIAERQLMTFVINNGLRSHKNKTNMLRTYFEQTFYDMPVEIAQKYAEGIRVAILAGKDFDGEKQEGFFLSKNRGFEDKLYVGNIHRIENHLYWKDEELADDDQIVNVVVIDGPVTRDGDGCSYGSKDHRDQIMYANTIPQVVGHIFILNTPGGAASARIDYEQAFADCREKGKPTVAWVDGLCCSAGQLVASLCDRTIVMNGRDTMGCIGTMCAFWGVANGTVDKDGYRYIELVSVTSPDKNAEYREAVDGKTEKLQAELDKMGEEFRETVRQNRPLVKEEHLTGKTFDAKDVMGALVDEIGDYNRAIEAVFELADQKIPAARFATNESNEEKTGTEDQEQQKDMAALNDQQKAAIAANPGAMVKVEDGHVKTVVETPFGPKEEEIAKPQNDKEMTEEEKKAAEVAEQPAATQEEQAPATEQPAEEAPATDAPAEEAPAEEAPAEGEDGNETHTISSGGAVTVTDTEITTVTEEAPAEEAPAEETIAEAQEEIDRITATLHNAEQMVEQKDKEIAELRESLSTLEGIAEERDQNHEDLVKAYASIDEKDKEIADLQASVQKLKKQVDDLNAEVKELSEKPAPMVSAASGIPADNGTGGAPKVNERPIRSGMTYKEIREAQRRK